MWSPSPKSKFQTFDLRSTRSFYIIRDLVLQIKNLVKKRDLGLTQLYSNRISMCVCFSVNQQGDMVMYHGVSCKYMVHKHDDHSFTWYLSEYHGSTIRYNTFCNANFLQPQICQLNILTECYIYLCVVISPKIFKYIIDLG